MAGCVLHGLGSWLALLGLLRWLSCRWFLVVSGYLFSKSRKAVLFCFRCVLLFVGVLVATLVCFLFVKRRCYSAQKSAVAYMPDIGAKIAQSGGCCWCSKTLA